MGHFYLQMTVGSMIYYLLCSLKSWIPPRFGFAGGWEGYLENLLFSRFYAGYC